MEHNWRHHMYIGDLLEKKDYVDQDKYGEKYDIIWNI
jgi:hypothetical protein